MECGWLYNVYRYMWWNKIHRDRDIYKAAQSDFAFDKKAATRKHCNG